MSSVPELTELTEEQKEQLTNLEVRFVGEIDTEMAKLHAKFAGPKADYDRLAVTRRNVLAGGNANGSATRQTRSRSGARVNRGEEFVTLVNERPGITIPEAAQAMGVKANYLYRVRDKSEENGLIRTEGGQCFPVTSQPELVPA